MTSKPKGFSIAGDGTVSRTSEGPHAAPAETNVVVWAPSIPTAFSNARNATIFTRLGTRHSSQELKTAFDATPDVSQAFCLSVNNVILVFSTASDEHTVHCRKALQMLQDRSMLADINDCILKAAKSTDAGIRFEQVGDHKVYMVINEGVPGRS